MKQFMFIYRSKIDQPEMSPEQMQQTMQAWISWIQGAVADGWMLSGGDARQYDSGRVGRDAQITDGPFVESKEIVGGYSLIQAENLEQAEQYTSKCPALANGGSVEVRELMMVNTN